MDVKCWHLGDYQCSFVGYLVGLVLLVDLHLAVYWSCAILFSGALDRYHNLLSKWRDLDLVGPLEISESKVSCMFLWSFCLLFVTSAVVVNIHTGWAEWISHGATSLVVSLSRNHQRYPIVFLTFLSKFILFKTCTTCLICFSHVLVGGNAYVSLRICHAW
jgi:hypothetical protein